MRKLIALLIAGLAVPLAAPAGAAADVTSRVVSLEAPDGVPLKAQYYSPGAPGPALVLLHQCNRDRTSWDAFAKKAAAAGFHVIAPDYRGFGESGGARGATPQEQQAVAVEKWPGDIDAAYNWLVAQPGVDRRAVGAAGASCGVNQATLLARRHPDVRALVLLSGNTTADGREYLRQSSGLPVLAAASRDDGNAVDMMRWIAGWSRHPSTRFVEYRAAGHGTEMFRVEPDLEPLMLTWFTTHVRQAPAAPAGPVTPPKPTLQEEFWTALTAPGGAGKARQIFEEARSRDPKVFLFPEAEANLFGYQLLQESRVKEAIEVFRLNVDAFPGSANTYDSLSDAYLADGNRAEARRYAERALKVLETDTQVTDELRAAIRESAMKKIKDLSE